MNKREHVRLCNALAKVCDLLAKDAQKEQDKGQGREEDYKRKAKVFRSLASIR